MTQATTPEALDLEAPGSQVVIEARLTLLGSATDQPLRLGSYTDEELAALDEPGRAPMAPSPWFTGLTQDEQATALTAALRGLTARGLYLAEPVDEGTRTFRFRASPELLALLSMRRHTGTVVVAERRLASTVDWALLYQQRAGMWLGEYVDHVGLHEFVLGTSEATVELLATWSGARPEAPCPELDVLLTREEVRSGADVLDEVGRSTAAVTITRMDVDDTVVETWSGVFTGPDGAYVSVAERDDVRYRGGTRDDVRDHWSAVLEP